MSWNLNLSSRETLTKMTDPKEGVLQIKSCTIVQNVIRRVNMITGKQRSYLKGLANSIQPIFQVGKGLLNDNMIKQFNEALEAREMIKVTVLKNALDSVGQICHEAAQLTGAEVVQIIGSRFVLYKESKNNKVIELP